MGERIPNAQLLTKYTYTNAIPGTKLFKVLMLAFCTAFAVVVVLPEKKWLREAAGCLVLLAIPCILGRKLELVAISGMKLYLFSMKWNVAIMCIFEIVLLLCTCSPKITALVSNIVLTVLYSANYFVYAFRGTSLKINELSAAGTAARVLKQYNFRPDSDLAYAWAIAVFLGVLAWKTGKGKEAKRHKRALAVNLALRFGCMMAGILIAFVSGYMLLGTDLLVEQGFLNEYGFQYQENYECNGYLVASCIDIQNSRVEKPKGYSEEKVEEILQEYYPEHMETEVQDLPHIILILNESFADLRVLGNWQPDEENMDFFYSLTDNTIRGYANASVLGGGTANSELEILTGCSVGLLPASYYAYQQGINRDTSSLVSILEGYGYKTYSMHPENRQNWNRAGVYQYFGFDESLWKEDFEDAELLHSGVTDLETYRKVEELYENRKEGERLFVFDLTMQNHGGYVPWRWEETYQRYGIDTGLSEPEIYSSLIKVSDDAFAQLVEYFAQEDEKVIICMVGDHQPKFEDEDFYKDIYAATEGLTEEDIIFNQYKTPFVIWANYDIEERSGMDISLNYLGPVLLEAAGMEGTAYFNYLSQLMQDYPIITANGYQDSLGRRWAWSGNKDEFPEYRLLQYNLLFGSGIVK